MFNFGNAQSSAPVVSTSGQAGVQQAPQVQQPHFGPNTSKDVGIESVTAELWHLAELFVNFPNNKSYPFKHTLLNTAQSRNSVQTQSLSAYAWMEAMEQTSRLPEGAGSFVPVEVVGFSSLKDRVGEQDNAIEHHKKTLDRLKTLVQERSQQQESIVKEKVDTIQKKHMKLCHKLLQIMSKLDDSERMLASEWHSGHFFRRDTSGIESKLSGMEEATSSEKNSGMLERVQELTRLSRVAKPSNMETDTPQNNGNIVDGAITGIDEVQQFLGNHLEGITKMQEVLRRIKRDLDIMGMNPSK